jgi:DNA adenine methylase
MTLPEIVLGRGEARLFSGSEGTEIARWRLNFDLTKPFLKWAGGKQWLSPLARYLAPEEFSMYCEPFLGAGALFFALRPPQARLSDANAELVKAYGGVRGDVDDVISRLEAVPYDIETFKKMRISRPRLDATAAVRFIYLNRTAFNGIYRVNRKGEFNVPFGKYENPTICQPDRLRPAAKALQSAVLRSQDFEVAVQNADASWFVYFDPPYITGHLNNGFVKWNARIFNWDDQARLARVAAELSARGARVLISNADHPAVSDLYQNFHHLRVRRHSLVGGRAASRKDVSELLISSFPIIDRLPGVRSPAPLEVLN